MTSGSAAGRCSMLDPEGSVEHQPSSAFPKVFLIPLAMLLAIAAFLLLAFSATQQKEPDFYTFKVVNIRGKLVSLEKYRGSVSLRGDGQLWPGLTNQPVHACLQKPEWGWQDCTLTWCRRAPRFGFTALLPACCLRDLSAAFCAQ